MMLETPAKISASLSGSVELEAVRMQPLVMYSCRVPEAETMPYPVILEPGSIPKMSAIET